MSVFKGGKLEHKSRWLIRKFCSRRCVSLSVLKDVSNQKFGYLTAINHIYDGNWLFRCDCGMEKVLRKNQVIAGKVRSCGCKKGELTFNKHHKNSRIYKKVNHSAGYLTLFNYEKHKKTGNGQEFEHRLVMKEELFKFPNPSKMDVHHIDGNKQNNSPENLLVLTHKHHMRIEKGWKFVDNKWFKVCKGCNKEIEVNRSNFHQRKTGKFVPQCKKCTLIEMKIKKGAK